MWLAIVVALLRGAPAALPEGHPPPAGGSSPLPEGRVPVRGAPLPEGPPPTGEGGAASSLPEGHPPMGGGAPQDPQGGGPNVAAMSGMPLPSPDLPTGTLSVRIALGGLAETLPGAEVQLVVASGASAARRRATTDAAGRVRFEELPPGARVTAAVIARGETFATRPVEMPAEGGVRMLLYVPKEGGPPPPPDGDAPRADRTLPAGTVVVRVTLGGDPAAEREVALVRVGRDDRTERATGRTGAGGEARFEKQPLSRDLAYFASVEHEGSAWASPPFQLQANAGARVAIALAGKTTDRAAIALSMRSHVIVDPGDEEVEILEVVEIENTTDRAFDPGPGGLSIWLPEGQSSAATDEETPRQVKVEDGRLVWRGLVPPGAHPLRFFFRTKADGDTLAFRQKTDVMWPHVTVVVRDLPGIEVEGEGVGGGDAREMGGQKFRVFHGPRVAAGGTIAFTVKGLPRPDTTARSLAGALALAILAWGVAAAWRRPPGTLTGGHPPAPPRRRRRRERLGEHEPAHQRVAVAQEVERSAALRTVGAQRHYSSFFCPGAGAVACEIECRMSVSAVMLRSW